ncbi:glycerophosphoryl diester phosphodiesterase [Luteitalea sp. TBR-22]|uniref:glycerophosphodiester phosphodiesterase n=1 Tax=Luteitalea sp. TBR-22 TaxID=2802971 RepID=UPI001AF7D7E0|nr:glycerophosphodiester phosphodiesterase [Luteitalea sp. TBR-22]BCS34451.1 glycerophosphoryl diester phosphodiesterase [Luteitalea sp. TBR-22]
MLSLDAPLVFAHRGGSKLRPENTIVAFDHGLALGADGLEFDVRLSRDGVPMVHHDETLDRTTSGSGPLAGLTADQLQALDAGHHFQGLDGESWRGRGARIPRLAEVLQRYPACPCIIELKGTDPEVGRVAAATVRQAGALGRVCFGGFTDDVVRAARGTGADVTTSAAREEIRWFLYRSWLGMAPRSTAFRAFQVPETSGATRVVSPRFVRAARRAGLPVAVWTVDDPAAMERLLGWGVMGLITDRPDLAVPLVARWKNG